MITISTLTLYDLRHRSDLSSSSVPRPSLIQLLYAKGSSSQNDLRIP